MVGEFIILFLVIIIIICSYYAIKPSDDNKKESLSGDLPFENNQEVLEEQQQIIIYNIENKDNFTEPKENLVKVKSENLNNLEKVEQRKYILKVELFPSDEEIDKSENKDTKKLDDKDKYSYHRFNNSGYYYDKFQRARDSWTILGASTDELCPICRSKLVVRKGVGGKFWGCSGYPKCRYTAEYE